MKAVPLRKSETNGLPVRSAVQRYTVGTHRVSDLVSAHQLELLDTTSVMWMWSAGGSGSIGGVCYGTDDSVVTSQHSNIIEYPNQALDTVSVCSKQYN